MSPPPETEGMEPCQVRDILFVKLPGVCVDGRAESCLVDKTVHGIDWLQDATQAVARSAGGVTGQRIDSVEHKKPRNLPQDCPESLVDRGGVAPDVLGPWGLLLKGLMPLDVACDAPVSFVKELVSEVGEDMRKWARGERHESLLCSEGERGVEAVGGAHATHAGLRGQ